MRYAYAVGLGIGLGVLGFLLWPERQPDKESVHLVVNADTAQYARDTLAARLDSLAAHADSLVVRATALSTDLDSARARLRRQKILTDQFAQTAQTAEDWKSAYEQAATQRDTAIVKLDTALFAIDTLKAAILAKNDALQGWSTIYEPQVEARIDSLERQLAREIHRGEPRRLFGIPLPSVQVTVGVSEDKQLHGTLGLGYRLKLPRIGG